MRGALHGWFMRRVASYLERIGRKAIGWDEILRGAGRRNRAILARERSRAGGDA